MCDFVCYAWLCLSSKIFVYAPEKQGSRAEKEKRRGDSKKRRVKGKRGDNREGEEIGDSEERGNRRAKRRQQRVEK